jgi:hypothetical protein
VLGLTIDKEARLLITNKRVLLIHSGVTSIPLAKILDLEVDHDRKVISVEKDGASKPVVLTTPDATRAGAILEVVTGT